MDMKGNTILFHVLETPPLGNADLFGYVLQTAGWRKPPPIREIKEQPSHLPLTAAMMFLRICLFRCLRGRAGVAHCDPLSASAGSAYYVCIYPGIVLKIINCKKRYKKNPECRTRVSINCRKGM